MNGDSYRKRLIHHFVLRELIDDLVHELQLLTGEVCVIDELGECRLGCLAVAVAR